MQQFTQDHHIHEFVVVVCHLSSSSRPDNLTILRTFHVFRGRKPSTRRNRLSKDARSAGSSSTAAPCLSSLLNHVPFTCGLSPPKCAP